MRHAGEDALDRLEDLIEELRQFDSLIEKKRGVFYSKSRAFIHFHEDPSGLYADYRDGDGFSRQRVETRSERRQLLTKVRAQLARN
jgi:hypothetical protein